MISNKKNYKARVLGEYTVESGDISGYAADEFAIPYDDGSIEIVAQGGTATPKQWYGFVSVKTSAGVEKGAGFKVVEGTGSLSGYLRVIESTSTFAAGDVITPIGTSGT